MSKIYFQEGHKELLKNVILNIPILPSTLSKNKDDISLVKKTKYYKEELIKNTKISVDVINVIFEYTHEIYDFSFTGYINDNTGEKICGFKLDNIFDFMFVLTKEQCQIHLLNIYNDIWNDCTYISHYNDILDHEVNKCKTEKYDSAHWLGEEDHEWQSFLMTLNSFFNAYMRKYYNKKKIYQTKK